MDKRDNDSLALRHKLGLTGLALFFLAFGILMEIRTAFLSRRMGDLTVYLRTAWAVRTGHDIYSVTDENGWHYQYPPLFAILLTPFADPPRDSTWEGVRVPFPVSAGLWYAFNIGSLFLSIHLLARILEPKQTRRFGRRWWGLRVLPMLAVMPPIAQSLMRGQVSILLLLFFSLFLWSWCRQRRLASGGWLSAAICVKVIPAYLLIFPLVRRDVRSLAGCLAGLIAGLVLVPLLVFGPNRTYETYESYARVLLLPGIGQGHDDSRAKELTSVTATDSQSFLATMHNSYYLDRDTRPSHADPLVRKAHWTIGALLTLLTLAVARRACNEQGALSALPAVLTFGCLVVLMNLISPVCHFHYFAMSLPLAMGILAASWTRCDQAIFPWSIRLLFATVFLCGILPVLPGLEILRDIGLAMYAHLTLWACGVLSLNRQARKQGAIGFACTELKAA